MKPIPLAIYLPHFLWFVSSTRIILLGALINISKISNPGFHLEMEFIVPTLQLLAEIVVLTGNQCS